jgi:hypothetical protein
MATNTWIKVAGVWKEVVSTWTKVGGVWKKDVVPKGSIGGVWKSFKTYVAEPPPPPPLPDGGVIVTNGLVAYYNSKQGVSGTNWSNIAPVTVGQYDATINGAVVQSDGIYFDGVDDSSQFPINETNITDFTIDLVLKSSTSNFTGSIDFSLYVEGYGDGASYYIGRVGDISGSTYLDVNGLNGLLGLSTDDVGFSIRYTTSNGTMDYIFPDGTVINGITDTQLKVNSILYNAKSFFNVVRYYNRALTLAEIQQNYAVGKEVGLPEQVIFVDDFEYADIAALEVNYETFNFGVTMVPSISQGVSATRLMPTAQHQYVSMRTRETSSKSVEFGKTYSIDFKMTSVLQNFTVFLGLVGTDDFISIQLSPLLPKDRLTINEQIANVDTELASVPLVNTLDSVGTLVFTWGSVITASVYYGAELRATISGQSSFPYTSETSFKLEVSATTSDVKTYYYGIVDIDNFKEI